eukprot:g1226.t1
MKYFISLRGPDEYEEPDEDMRGVLKTYRGAVAMDGNIGPLVFVQLGFTDLKASPTRVLDRVLYFVKRAMAEEEPIVIRCGGGYGRTGSVLASLIAVKRRVNIGTVIGTVLANDYDETAAEEVKSLNAASHQYETAWTRWLADSEYLKDPSRFSAQMERIKGRDPASPARKNHGVWTFFPDGRIEGGAV